MKRRKLPERHADRQMMIDDSSTHHFADILRFGDGTYLCWKDIVDAIESLEKVVATLQDKVDKR